jgi:hypothetical protein
VIVGTTWAAYLFRVLALIARPDVIRQGVYSVIARLASRFVQLVMRPVSIDGDNIQAAAADTRSESNHKGAEAV